MIFKVIICSEICFKKIRWIGDMLLKLEKGKGTDEEI